MVKFEITIIQVQVTSVRAVTLTQKCKQHSNFPIKGDPLNYCLLIPVISDEEVFHTNFFRIEKF